MIDKKYIGKKLPDFKVAAEAGQLRFFAKAVGETNPVYTDEAAARDAGHPGIPLPPTFLFSLEFEMPSDWYVEMGIDIARILHGEQSFTYHRMPHAGETLHYEPRITDVYDKKGGALSFIVKDTRVTNQKGEHVADLRAVIVHRNV